MGSTFFSLRYHIVFSTKDRLPLVAPMWINDLHGYLGGTVAGLGGVPEAIGGIADHIHLLVSLKPTHTLADFVRELKKASSVRMAELFEARSGWQDGYAAFTVSASGREKVREYIEHQEEHHRRRDFRAELEQLLTRHGIEFRPEYLD